MWTTADTAGAASSPPVGTLDEDMLSAVKFSSRDDQLEGDGSGEALWDRHATNTRVRDEERSADAAVPFPPSSTLSGGPGDCFSGTAVSVSIGEAHGEVESEGLSDGEGEGAAASGISDNDCGAPNEAEGSGLSEQEHAALYDADCAGELGIEIVELHDADSSSDA